MSDLLAALRRELPELERRIATLERADGNALSFPMDGRVAA